MTTSIKLRLTNRPAPNVKRVSVKESARVAHRNPGPGTPLSMLSVGIQQRFRDGETVSMVDLEADLLKHLGT